MERTFGHYARVLVDMDLNNELVHIILVERKGFAFFVDIDYETLPDFCTNCQITGHHIEVCKRVKAHDGNQGPHKMHGKAKVKKEWVFKPLKLLMWITLLLRLQKETKNILIQRMKLMKQ